jgi:hypothetical protein
MNNYFINNAIDTMVRRYLNEQKDNILDYIMNSLVLIYGEYDIINPYQLEKEGILTENMTKFNYSKESIHNFYELINNFYLKHKNNLKPNPYLYEIQKELINMYVLKKAIKNSTNEEVNDFKQTLFLKSSKNEFVLNAVETYLKDNADNLENYFEEEVKKEPIKKIKKLLSPEAYRVINQDYTTVNLLSGEEVERINDLVYEALDVRKNVVNFDYLFEKALADFYKKEDKLTSGNGYVDTLLIISAIATIVMVIIIFTLWFF